MRKIALFVILTVVVSFTVSCGEEDASTQRRIVKVLGNEGSTTKVGIKNNDPDDKNPCVPNHQNPACLKKMGAETGMWLRVSSHPLANGDVVIDGYTSDNTMAYCWWQEACRGRSLKADRLQKGEGCIGHLICSKDPRRVGTPAGLELGAKARPAPESDMDVMGK